MDDAIAASRSHRPSQPSTRSLLRASPGRPDYGTGLTPCPGLMILQISKCIRISRSACPSLGASARVTSIMLPPARSAEKPARRKWPQRSSKKVGSSRRMSMAAEPVLTSAASSESRIPQARPEAKYESGALFEWATAALCLLRGEQIRRALGSGGVSSPSGEVHHVVVGTSGVRSCIHAFALPHSHSKT